MKLIVRETVHKTKRIGFYDARERWNPLSCKVKELYEIERDHVEGEGEYPSDDPIHKERSEVGYWKRLVAAMRGK